MTDYSVYRETDVLVVGGGPAGIGAALGAARSGAETLLLERYGFFGGVAAYGLGMPINQMRPGGEPRGAVHEMVIQRLEHMGEDAVRVVGHAVVCNVEYLKVAVMDALEAAGAEYLLHSRVVDALVDDGAVTGVVLATKQGLTRIKARTVVDCTGDADVAYMAGAATLKGRESDGFLSPMTLCLLITNVDVQGARAFERQDRGMERFIEAHRDEYPLLPARMHFELGPFPIRNSLVINHAGTRLRGVLDGTRVEDMTEAERYSRRQALQIVHALRKHGGEAFGQVQLAATGPQVGVRETRRLKGLYQLTEEDALQGSRFDDVVAWRSGMLDIGFVRYEEMQVHDVPYRALVPETLEGLLAAGRCISATHVAASAGKSMGNCVATGHAAGVACALAVSRGVQPRRVPVSDIQHRLCDQDVPLDRSAL
jgi:succinate dehydrogenase/fumarate reductase flavoprotein subunit